MLLAQAAPQVVVHANDLYHEWGLMAAVLGLCVPILGIFWWLMQLSDEPITLAKLRIRSSLAGLFQSTVVEEARKLFSLIDDHLPYSLSQVDESTPSQSAFDKLCQGLKRIDEAEPNRELYREVIESSLSGIIVSQINKLFAIVEANPSGKVDLLLNPTGLKFGFEQDTEVKLTEVARELVYVNKKEKWVHRHTTFTYYSFLIGTIMGFLSTPFFFFDYKWAFVACVVCLTLFGVCTLFGLINVGLLHRCKQWITNSAERRQTLSESFEAINREVN